jgi:tRNA modification GTPase
MIIKNDIIVAKITPTGNGAISIIRVSGKNVRFLLNEFAKLSSKKKISEVETHTINHGFFIDETNENVDEVLFFVMDSPRSFTGEDVIEISCHCNEFIIKKIIDLICSKGSRIAHRGEFTRRAVENNKIDILQAESINDIINSQNELSTKASIKQLTGSLSKIIYEIDYDLSKIASWCQANFEFLDEERNFKNKIEQMLNNLNKKISQILKENNIHEKIRNGVKIPIIGTVNSGKSLLFNSLISKNRAIVSPIKGTTRDIVETTINKNGLFFTFLDTAGIRKTKNKIEIEGIKRGLKELNESDVILIVFDISNNYKNEEINFYKKTIKKYNKKIILVFNKSDSENKINIFKKNEFYLNIKDKVKFIFVSSKKNINLNLLWEIIFEKINITSENSNIPYLLNKRHLELLLNLKIYIKKITEILKSKNIYFEILLKEIHNSQKIISNLSGKSIEEKSFDLVFKEFCVGK